MKYEKEVNQLLDDVVEDLREDWMTEEDIAEIRSGMLEESGITYQDLDEALIAGVGMGVPIEDQMVHVKRRFTTAKQSETLLESN